jgi:hypothetical protein
MAWPYCVSFSHRYRHYSSFVTEKNYSYKSVTLLINIARITMTELIAVVTITLLAVISPGPDFAMVSRNSLLLSRRAGIFTACGIGAGVLIHVSYTLIGVGVLIQQSPWLFNLLKGIGAAYLIYLGFTLLRNATHHDAAPTTTPAAISDLAALKTGFLTNALNPKTTIFPHRARRTDRLWPLYRRRPCILVRRRRAAVFRAGRQCALFAFAPRHRSHLWRAADCLWRPVGDRRHQVTPRRQVRHSLLCLSGVFVNHLSGSTKHDETVGALLLNVRPHRTPGAGGGRRGESGR